MTDRHIVVPVGWQADLLRDAVFDATSMRGIYDTLLGRKAVWVECLEHPYASL